MVSEGVYSMSYSTEAKLSECVGVDMGKGLSLNLCHKDGP